MITSLITGGAGFIGSQITHTLVQRGEEVVILDNFSYGREDNLQFDDMNLMDKVIIGDIRNTDLLHKIFLKHKIDYVYNVAGIAPLPDCQINPQEAISVNVGGFANLLEVCRQYGVRTVIHASTNAIYENETAFPTYEQFSSLPSLIYPNTKYCAERFAESFCRTYNMNVVCLRFSNVYGPHVDCLRKHPPFVAYMVRELYYDRTPIFHSDGTQRRDYVYVDDLVELAIATRSCKGFDTVNCSSNTNHSVNEMYQMAQELMGKNIPAEYASDAHYWANYPDLYKGAFPIKEEVLTHEIKKYSLCANEHAKEKYGWEPKVPMREGLKRLIKAEVELLKNHA